MKKEEIKEITEVIMIMLKRELTSYLKGNDIENYTREFNIDNDIYLIVDYLESEYLNEKTRYIGIGLLKNTVVELDYIYVYNLTLETVSYKIEMVLNKNRELFTQISDIKL